MKNLIIILFLLIPILTFSQNKICENISFNSFEIDAKQENTLAINVKVQNQNSFMPISYPGFLLRNEKGETVAQSTKEFATYALANNTVYNMEIVKKMPSDFSGTIEIYKGFLGHQLKSKVCTQTVQFRLDNKQDQSVLATDGLPSIDNTIYLEYQGNDTQGAGSIRKSNPSEWFEFRKESATLIGVYRETHRDENYIYLISRDAIFQFDLTRKKIMKNGVDLLDISAFSNEEK